MKKRRSERTIEITLGEYKELLRAKTALDQIIALENELIYEYRKTVFDAIIGRKKEQEGSDEII